jgi:hypothetical protein
MCGIKSADRMTPVGLNCATLSTDSALDMGTVVAVDTTGFTTLQDLKEDIEQYAGKAAELRFTNLHEGGKI